VNSLISVAFAGSMLLAVPIVGMPLEHLDAIHEAVAIVAAAILIAAAAVFLRSE
jgi:hypothetical protein